MLKVYIILFIGLNELKREMQLTNNSIIFNDASIFKNYDLVYFVSTFINIKTCYFELV